MTPEQEFERDMMDCAELDAYKERSAREWNADMFTDCIQDIFAKGDVWQMYLGRRLRREMEHARWWHMKRQRELCLYSECNP